MTVQEMIQEAKEQYLEDCLLGYREINTFDDSAFVPIEIDYTVQS